LRFPLPASAEKIQKAGVKKREIIFRVTTALSMGLSKGLSCREDITANFNSAKINPDVVRTFVRK